MADDLPRRQLGMRHLRQIVAGVSDGVILIGTDQIIQWANKPALEMHGVTELEALGGNVAEYCRRFELRYCNRHRLAEGTYPMECVLAGEAFDEVLVEVAPAGSNEPQWTHRIRSLVLLDEHDVSDCLVLNLDDETEHYHAEERFERAFNANPAPALIVRLDDLRHLRVNRGFLETTGCDEDKVVGRSIYEVNVLEGAARREFAIERLKGAAPSRRWRPCSSFRTAARSASWWPGSRSRLATRAACCSPSRTSTLVPTGVVEVH